MFRTLAIISILAGSAAQASALVCNKVFVDRTFSSEKKMPEQLKPFGHFINFLCKAYLNACCIGNERERHVDRIFYVLSYEDHELAILLFSMLNEALG